MNKDLIILLQNSMAHSTAIHLKNDDKVDIDKVIEDAIHIATKLADVATPKTKEVKKNIEINLGRKDSLAHEEVDLIYLGAGTYKCINGNKTIGYIYINDEEGAYKINSDDPWQCTTYTDANKEYIVKDLIASLVKKI